MFPPRSSSQHEKGLFRYPVRTPYIQEPTVLKELFSACETKDKKVIRTDLLRRLSVSDGEDEPESLEEPAVTSGAEATSGSSTKNCLGPLEEMIEHVCSMGITLQQTVPDATRTPVSHLSLYCV